MENNREIMGGQEPKHELPKGLIIKDLSKDKGVYFEDGYYDTYFDLPLHGRTANN